MRQARKVGLLSLAAIVACGSSEEKQGDAPCLSGESAPCVGDDGCSGTQTCAADDTGWGACVCPSEPDPLPPPTDAGTDVSEPDVGPPDAEAGVDAAADVAEDVAPDTGPQVIRDIGVCTTNDRTRPENLIEVLTAAGIDAPLDYIDCYESIPPLEVFLEYRRLLVWANLPFPDTVAIGDVLADYSDLGRGLVVSTAIPVQGPSMVAVRGRFAVEQYHPIESQGAVQQGPDNYLVPVLPDHPILEGVTSFNYFYFWPNTVLSPDATRVADWSNGEILIATKIPTVGRIVGINSGLETTDTSPNHGWDPATTDGAQLIINMLNWVDTGD